MLTKPIAVAGLVAGVIVAAGAGAYLAVRQNAAAPPQLVEADAPVRLQKSNHQIVATINKTRASFRAAGRYAGWECVPSHQGMLPLRWHWHTAFLPASVTSTTHGLTPVLSRETIC